MCPWYRLDVTQQRSLYLMLTRAQNPILVSAIFSGIDLMAFTTVSIFFN